MKFDPKPEEKRNFVKLKSGDTIKGIFRGEIYKFKTHWADKRGILCTGENCELCRAGSKSSTRFRVNFIIKENSTYVAKIWEGGMTFYDQLRTLNDGDYPLEKFPINITRHGERLDTVYTPLPAPNGPISQETEYLLSQVVLNELGHIMPSETEPPHIEDADADIPF